MERKAILLLLWLVTVTVVTGIGIPRIRVEENAPNTKIPTDGDYLQDWPKIDFDTLPDPSLYFDREPTDDNDKDWQTIDGDTPTDPSYADDSDAKDFGSEPTGGDDEDSQDTDFDTLTYPSYDDDDYKDREVTDDHGEDGHTAFFSIYPTDTFATRDANVTFRCSVRKPKFYSLFWHYKADNSSETPPVVIAQDSSYKIVSNDKGDFSLEIVRVDVRVLGLYLCYATPRVRGEGYPVESPAAWLRMAEPPQVDINETVYGIEGETVSLRAKLSGHPKPTGSLYRNNTVLLTASHTDELEYNISNVTEADAGLYQVVATNIAGERKEVQVLVVQHRPKILGLHMWCADDTTVRPRSHTEWSVNGRLLQQETETPLFVKTPERREVVYACRSTNDIGQDELVVRISRKVEDPRAVVVGPNRVIVWWEKTFGVTGNRSSKGYHHDIQWQEREQDWQMPHRVAAAQNYYLIKNLTPEKVYRFRVRAMPVDGTLTKWSEPSEWIQVSDDNVTSSQSHRLESDTNQDREENDTSVAGIISSTSQSDINLKVAVGCSDSSSVQYVYLLIIAAITSCLFGGAVGLLLGCLLWKKRKGPEEGPSKLSQSMVVSRSQSKPLYELEMVNVPSDYRRQDDRGTRKSEQQPVELPEASGSRKEQGDAGETSVLH